MSSFNDYNAGCYLDAHTDSLIKPIARQQISPSEPPNACDILDIPPSLVGPLPSSNPSANAPSFRLTPTPVFQNYLSPQPNTLPPLSPSIPPNKKPKPSSKKIPQKPNKNTPQNIPQILPEIASTSSNSSTLPPNSFELNHSDSSQTSNKNASDLSPNQTTLSLPKKLSKKQSKKYSNQNTSCFNCGTTTTPLWRRTPDRSHKLCNACGLYFRQYNKHRTIHSSTSPGFTLNSPKPKTQKPIEKVSKGSKLSLSTSSTSFSTNSPNTDSINFFHQDTLTFQTHSASSSYIPNNIDPRATLNTFNPQQYFFSNENPSNSLTPISLHPYPGYSGTAPSNFNKGSPNSDFKSIYKNQAPSPTSDQYLFENHSFINKSQSQPFDNIDNLSQHHTLIPSSLPTIEFDRILNANSPDFKINDDSKNNLNNFINLNSITSFSQKTPTSASKSKKNSTPTNDIDQATKIRKKPRVSKLPNSKKKSVSKITSNSSSVPTNQPNMVLDSQSKSPYTTLQTDLNGNKFFSFGPDNKTIPSTSELSPNTNYSTKYTYTNLPNTTPPLDITSSKPNNIQFNPQQEAHTFPKNSFPCSSYIKEAVETSTSFDKSVNTKNSGGSVDRNKSYLEEFINNSQSCDVSSNLNQNMLSLNELNNLCFSQLDISTFYGSGSNTEYFQFPETTSTPSFHNINQIDTENTTSKNSGLNILDFSIPSVNPQNNNQTYNPAFQTSFTIPSNIDKVYTHSTNTREPPNLRHIQASFNNINSDTEHNIVSPFDHIMGFTGINSTDFGYSNNNTPNFYQNGYTNNSTLNYHDNLENGINTNNPLDINFGIGTRQS
ncbi:hypothetical protein BB559_001513 [Furculomyces boomerangus]|uniref:GATA-type domain-containing protein n=2 Tax=Harpellales TaxID=61421 RepID=A0A2T9XWZ8_9FUNG|nr:hypothetical protein BB559_007522 [Furculomyces boomerangus]PVU98501.1 hypothetical protein BB559_001513 [Furculomyces boomerangus]PVZ98904.1 hypothetical protein BB558_005086 [Smittium angustum]